MHQLLTRLGITALTLLLSAPSLLADEAPAAASVQAVTARFTTLAWAALQQRDYTQAAEVFERLVQVDPTNTDAKAGWALALHGLGQTDQAIALLEQDDAAGTLRFKTSYVLARLYLAADQPRLAAQRLRQLVAEDPELERTRLWLSKAYFEDEKFLAAYRTLRQVDSADPATGQTTQLAQGIALARLGLRRAATTQFAAHASQSPAAPAARLAESFQASLAEQALEERLSGFVRLAARYDDNANVAPSAAVLGVLVNEQDSAGLGVNANLQYQLATAGAVEVSVGYRHFQTINFSASQGDLLDSLLYLRLTTQGMAAEVPWQLALEVAADHLLLDGRSFLTRITTTPAATVVLSDELATTVFMRHTWLNFLGQGNQDDTPQDRDSHDLTLGVTPTLQLPWERMTLQAGYTFGRNFAQGADYDYDSHRVFVGWTWPVPLPLKDVSLTVVGAAAWRDYAQVDSVFGRQRRDLELSCSTLLRLPLAQQTSLLLEYSLTRNDSTLPAFDFRRQVISLGVEYRF